MIWKVNNRMDNFPLSRMIKKFNKKLVLNKSTVADLDGRRMSDIRGGGRPSVHW